MAKGYARTYGVSYSNTFSLIAELTFVRLFISLVASENWPCINWILRMHSFMVISTKRFIWSNHLVLLLRKYGKVCHLKRSLYGLKQSPRALFGKFSEVV